MSERTQALDWEQRFREGTTPWERGGANPALLAWLAAGRLAPGRVIIPGAGRSAEPRLLAERGFTVTVLDLSETAVAFQAAALAGTASRVEHADVVHWTPPEPVDVVYDQTCLCALPPDIWPEYAAGVATWLRPGGLYAALFMQSGKTDGPPYHCDIDAMRALFPDTVWLWPAQLEAASSHPNGLAEQPVILERR